MSTKHKTENLDTLVRRFENSYREEKNQETQALFNDFVDVINKRRATIQNVLAAIELVKATMIAEKLKQIHNELKFG